MHTMDMISKAPGLTKVRDYSPFYQRATRKNIITLFYSLIFIFPAVSSPVTDEDRMEEGRKCGKAAMSFSFAGAVLGIITIVYIMGDIVNNNEDYYYE